MQIAIPVILKRARSEHVTCATRSRLTPERRHHDTCSVWLLVIRTTPRPEVLTAMTVTPFKRARSRGDRSAISWRDSTTLLRETIVTAATTVPGRSAATDPMTLQIAGVVTLSQVLTWGCLS